MGFWTWLFEKTIFLRLLRHRQYQNLGRTNPCVSSQDPLCIQGIAGSNGSGRNYFSAVPVPKSNPERLVTTLMSSSKSLDYIGTVRGRIGYAVIPTLLVYGTGGLAYGWVSANVNGAQHTTQLQLTV